MHARVHPDLPSEKDRDDYLVHPDHTEFGKVLGPVLAEVLVIDFRARD